MNRFDFRFDFGKGISTSPGRRSGHNIPFKGIPLLAVSLIFVLIFILITACTSETEKQRKELEQQAKAIIYGNDSTSVRLIELTIRSIETFIHQHPELSNPEEMKNYLKELHRSLDVHQLKQYTERFRKITSSAYTDLKKVEAELQAFSEEFSVGYGSELATRQTSIGEMLAELKRMQLEFVAMQQFFAQDFPPTLEAFNYLAGLHSPTYENSDFEAVRRSWKLISGYHRTKIAERELDEKVRKFGQYLKNDAETIANTLYKGYIVDRGRPTETLGMSRISEHPTYDGRECEGSFRVYLKGSFLGWNKGWTQLTVKGVLLIGLNVNNEKARVEYKREEFRVEGSEF